MRQMNMLVVAAVLIGGLVQADAQPDLIKKLDAQFVPTKFTADKQTIVTQGAVVALLKDNLLVFSVTVPVAPISVLKKDKLTQGFGDLLGVDMADGLGRPGGSSSIPQKKLVAGEKVLVRALELTKDAILVQVVTDAYDDGRYFGTIKFLLPKGSVPAPEEALKVISEVLQVQPSEDQGTQQIATANAASTPAEPPPPPPTQYQDIPPPPPPPQPAPTVSIGETKIKVAADLGEPQRKAVVGAREIFFYSEPKMKVTFTNGKVSDVE